MKKLGKKKDANAGYSRKNLETVAQNLEEARKPVTGGEIPELHVNRENLEKTIKTDLTKKERDVLEKFFGLIPGTINHSKHIWGLGRLASNNMIKEVKEVLSKLVSVKYLAGFDEEVAKLVEDLAKKVDKGDLDITDIDIIKYLEILCIIFDGGPKMPFDNDDEIDVDESENASFDDFGMLTAMIKAMKELPDHAINLKLLIEAIEMFDIKDVMAMKKFVGLKLSKKDEREYEDVKKVKTLMEIRNLKEKVFPLGSWNTTIELIIGKKKNFQDFIEAMEQVRRDLNILKNYETDEEYSFVSAKGEKTTVKVIKIGDLEFTDPYEIMFLCVARNIIL